MLCSARAISSRRCLGQPAVLLGELRRRLRAVDRERAKELGLAALDLGVDQRLQVLLRFRERLILGLLTLLSHRPSS